MGIGGDALELHDPPRPAVHDLERVERETPAELDVAEAGQVLDRGERRRSRRAAPALASAVGVAERDAALEKLGKLAALSAGELAE